LFDFDGTLVDPRDGLLDSFVHGLAAVGVTVDDKTSLEPLIGPRFAMDSVLFGLAEPPARGGAPDFPGTTGVLEYQPYDGIIELLDDLRPPVPSCWSRRSRAVRELIIEHFDMKAELAAVVAGSSVFAVGEGRTRRAGIARAARPCGRGHDGDREFDIPAQRPTTFDRSVVGATVRGTEWPAPTSSWTTSAPCATSCWSALEGFDHR
jgi:phosphoglycolate phosphatase-like HAD superfamily hydrolase